MDSRRSPDLHHLPPDLPVPVDDGACDHLPGARVPSVRLQSTAGRWVDVAEIAGRPAVLFFYTRTGEAGKPAGPAWDSIPGARGCTPQSCGFRDRYREFGALGVAVYGVSTQETRVDSSMATMGEKVSPTPRSSCENRMNSKRPGMASISVRA